PRSSLPRLTLPRAAYGFVLVTMALVSLTAGLFLYSRAGDLADQALDQAVRLRTQAAAAAYARAIHEDWSDLTYLAAEAGRGDLDRVRGLMDGMRGDGTRISWIGWAGTDGVVRTASDGLLDGADVSARPWFRNGLRGGFAGDVHEAVLLASLLPETETGEPPRFIDLALPVRTTEGEAAGVVAVHIDFDWATRFLSETADSLGLDLFLIGADGSVIAATTGERPTTAELQILRAARAGTATATRETWPDGNDYFATLLPQVGYDDLP
ncbi:cache domain-containing protein, partial [Roseivivax isoporae]